MVYLFFLTLMVMNFTTTSAHDFLWHLKTGEWILENLSIPRMDLYLDPHAPSAQPWIDLHWGFQVMIAVVHSFGGFWALQILKIVLIGLTFFILLKMVRGKDMALGFLLGVLLVSGLAAQGRFQMRPELVTFLMMSLFLLILEWERERSTRALWNLPLLQLLWTNVEGLFMIGPALILIYFCGEGLRKNLSWRLLAVFVLTLFASFINPYGLRGFLFPFRLLWEISSSSAMPYPFIGEFLPPYSSLAAGSHILFFYGLLALCGVVVFFQRMAVCKTHLLLMVAFGSLAMLAQRNIALFALVSPIVILKNWPERPHFPNRREKRHCALVRLWRKGQSPEAISALQSETGLLRFARNDKVRVFERSGILALIAVLIFLNLSALSNRLYAVDQRVERWGVGLAPEIYPHKALVFLRRIRIDGILFHPLEWGPAVIYQGWPQFYPWIDTRLEIYGLEFLRQYQELYGDPFKFSQYIRKNHFAGVLLDHLQMNSLALISHLAQDPEWSLVYFDEVAVVFLRKERGQAAGAKIDGRTPHEFSLQENLYLGRFFMALNHPEARSVYRQVLRQSPKCVEAWINLGYLDERGGKIPRALCFLNQALELNPKNATLYYNLGVVYLRLGKYDLAVRHLEKSLHLKKSERAAHNLAVAKKRLLTS